MSDFKGKGKIIFLNILYKFCRVDKIKFMLGIVNCGVFIRKDY